MQKTIYKLIYILGFFIFYQQVFVVNIGASLKIYELIALILLILFCFKDRPKIYGGVSLILFFLFVIIPTLSYIMYLFDADKELYYNRFPEGYKSLRTHVYLAPTILLLYYYFNWVTINYIISSNTVYENKTKVIRCFVISATVVCFYNFYSYIFMMRFGFPDLIPGFLDFRNSPTHVTGRFCGFSVEPGTYIVLQTWTVYYLFFYQSFLKFKHIVFLRVVNVVSLLMTLSSMLVPAILLLLLCMLQYYKFDMKKKVVGSVLLVLFIVSLVKIVTYYNLENLIHYVTVEKITNYVSESDNTLDSGTYRNYTARLGMTIFKDNPILGSGGGTSCFYMWRNEKNMGIKFWGERLSPTSYPQNSYVKVLAELGIVGFTFLLLFLGRTLKVCWKYRKENVLCNTSFYGTLFIIVVMFSVYPETSLFLWFNIALALNEVYHLSKNKHKEDKCNVCLYK